MMTPDAYRKAAIHILGIRRVSHATVVHDPSAIDGGDDDNIEETRNGLRQPFLPLILS